MKKSEDVWRLAHINEHLIFQPLEMGKKDVILNAFNNLIVWHNRL